MAGVFPFLLSPCPDVAPEQGRFCCCCLRMLRGERGKAASSGNAYCTLKPSSFTATQISLFWHKHPATERKGKEVLIGCNKLFIIVGEKNTHLLPFIVK